MGDGITSKEKVDNQLLRLTPPADKWRNSPHKALVAASDVKLYGLCKLSVQCELNM